MISTRVLRPSVVLTTTLLAASLVAAVPAVAAAAPSAVISGTVTVPSGVEISRANIEVSVYSAVDREWAGYSPVAADGSFAVAGLEPGDYKVQFTTHGAALAQEWWQDATDFSTAHPITLGDGEAFTADTSLERGATLSGAVTGGRVSRGAGWALASLLTDEGWRLEGSAPLAADGRYTIGGLRPGTYRVLFSDNGGFGGDMNGESITGWQEWWSDAMTADLATNIEVGRGQSVSGFNADLNTVAGQATWPAVSGAVRVGSTLTATSGAWPAGTRLEYRWYANGVEIAGATTAKLALTAAQHGKRVEVGVYGLKPGETSYQLKFSAQTGVVATGTLVGATPKITGAVAIGARLAVSRGTWTAGTTFRYQWYADGKAIAKATSSTYAVPSTLLGKRITVAVVGSQAGFSTLVKKSAATARVAKAPAPTVSGAARVGSKLTARAGTWTTGSRLSYQWYADGVAVRGATASTFAVTSAQRGKAITVRVRGTKSGYATVTRASAATLRVPTASRPTISGRAIATVTLTARPGTWTSGTSFSYQWYASGRAISGATRSTLTVSNGLVGKTITVRVTGRKSGYTTTAYTSAATSTVRSGTARPASRDHCPSSHPIKGNQTTRHTTDWIYHVPGGDYYAVTDPEQCFATERAAQLAGYRASKR